MTCTLRKELQLQHRAPVVHVSVMDRHSQPLPAPLEVTNGRAKAPDMTSGHQLVVVSEEQFKVRRNGEGRVRSEEIGERGGEWERIEWGMRGSGREE